LTTRLWADNLRLVGSHEGTGANFGLLIAYIIPGYTALQGLPFLSNSSPAWGAVGGEVSPTLPSFLSGTIAAIAAGLTVSTVRWLLIDTFHQSTGVRPPQWDFALLDKNVTAFEFLIHIHYRYYKFYANEAVALVWAYFAGGYTLGWRGLVYWLLVILFLLASRDSLRKYYERAGRLLGAPGEEEPRLR
jgi:hypothetical protein